MALLSLASFLSASDTERVDLRSLEVVRNECRSDHGVSETTLFGNGTGRSRIREDGELSMLLVEFDPAEFMAFQRRLEAETPLAYDDTSLDGIDGPLVEHCTVDVRLSGRPAFAASYGRFDSLPLNLSRLLHVVLDLEEAIRRVAAEGNSAPAVEARRGQILVRNDGERFRVVGFTDDGGGIELEGVSVPITMFVEVEQLGQEFRPEGEGSGH